MIMVWSSGVLFTPLHLSGNSRLIIGKIIIRDKYTLLVLNNNFVLNTFERLLYIYILNVLDDWIKKEFLFSHISIAMNYCLFIYLWGIASQIDLLCKEYKRKSKNGEVMVTPKILWQFTLERQPFLRYLLDKSGGKYRARRQGHPYETRASWHLGHLVGPTYCQRTRRGGFRVQNGLCFTERKISLFFKP